MTSPSTALADSTDVELAITGARLGEGWARERLYRQFAPAVLGFVRALGVAGPEDLTNQVFILLFDQLPDFDGGQRAFRAWLYGIVGAVLRVSGPTAPGRTDRSPGQPGHIDVDDRIQSALATLDAEHRQVLLLGLVAEMEPAEIAVIWERSIEEIETINREALDRVAAKEAPMRHLDGQPLDRPAGQQLSDALATLRSEAQDQRPTPDARLRTLFSAPAEASPAPASDPVAGPGPGEITTETPAIDHDHRAELTGPEDVEGRFDRDGLLPPDLGPAGGLIADPPPFQPGPTVATEAGVRPLITALGSVRLPIFGLSLVALVIMLAIAARSLTPDGSPPSSSVGTDEAMGSTGATVRGGVPASDGGSEDEGEADEPLALAPPSPDEPFADSSTFGTDGPTGDPEAASSTSIPARSSTTEASPSSTTTTTTISTTTISTTTTTSEPTTTLAPRPGPNLLSNGGFERTSIGDGTLGFVPVDGWSSSEPGNLIEVWGTGFSGVPSHEGRHHIELNGSAAATITQTVVVEPQTTYRWSLAHRGRSDDDTIRVVIDRIPVANETSSPGAWRTIAGEITTGPDQTEVTFVLQAVDAGSVGNLIDAITFHSVAGPQG